MNSKRLFWIFFTSYFLLRVFSFFFPPITPLHEASIVNTLVSLTYLLLTTYYLLRRDSTAWYLITAEILLGGAGGFLSVGPISLRTSLLLTSIGIFFGQKLYDTWKAKNVLNALRSALYDRITVIIFALIGYTTLAALLGLMNGHVRGFVISDLIPYFFLLYYFPLREIIKDEKFRSFSWNAIVAAIIANALFILLTLAIYSSGLYILQNSYYHWYRDVGLGKITELPFHFYRIVLNEHLLLIPITLWLAGKHIYEKTKVITSYSLLFIPLLLTLSLNLTRIYILALGVGLLALFRKTQWKRWLTVSISILIFFFTSFTTIHLIASRGESLGWEIFGLRLQSIVSPSVEDSSLSRMMLLPKIVEKIKAHPITGSGPGDTITVFSPIFDTDITTPHFDWGYLEIIAELGIVGLTLWALLTVYCLLFTYKTNSLNTAPLIALGIINLTSPALFHVLGTILIVVLVSLARMTHETV